MSALEVIALGTLALAVLPAALVAVNLPLLRAPRPRQGAAAARVSVLIPARDEEARIAACVEAAVASRGVELEVVVMDDHSSDRTAEIVAGLAARDPRVRLERAPALPPGWSGKPHACQALAEAARHPVLVFLDADVILAPDGVARAVAFLERRGADLVSGFPHQRTGTFVERLLIPLIHFVLLGYLPLVGMRWSRSEAFAAGCGQLFVVRRDAYREAGGHGAVRATFHDGITLPRAFRRAGLRTDLVDGDPLASCRMYGGAVETLRGLAKNAHEGMAGPVAIWVWTGLLGGGHVLPAVLAAVGVLVSPAATWTATAAAAVGVGIATRLALALRFRQPVVGALLHPAGVAVLLAVQWWSRTLRRRGAGVAWKGRAQA